MNLVRTPFVLVGVLIVLLIASFPVMNTAADNDGNPSDDQKEKEGKKEKREPPPVLSDGDIVTLEPGIPSFWSFHPFVDVLTPTCDAPDADALELAPTLTLGLRLTGPAAELRVGAEHVQTGEDRCARFWLVAPDGTIFQGSATSFAVEAVVPTPSVGDWTIRLLASGGPRLDVRMRALALVELPPSPDPATILLPDLRPAAPWELQFSIPEGLEVGGLPIEDPAHLGGPSTCTPYEIAQNGDLSQCLRFSFGAANLGPGKIELHYSGVTTVQAVNATQWMYAPDGHHEEQPAGKIYLHAVHAHNHWDEAYLTELFPVTKKSLSPSVGTAFKKSGCWGDYLVGAWERFDQAPAGSGSSSGNCRHTQGVAVPMSTSYVGRRDSFLAVSTGWMDVYPWSISDNYVKFDGKDGEYVLRFTVDPVDLVLEADETNNVAYAYFSVKGTDIEMLERGFGLGPHDKDRIVVDGPWVT